MKRDHDAIIIGAGIGGLTAGCLLARAGMNVLIAEQHRRPGGYCSSFQRGGYTFDAAAHSFGGFRRGGMVRQVFDALGVADRLDVRKFNPSDTIIAQPYTISFLDSPEATAGEIDSFFPGEGGNFMRFASFISNPDPHAFMAMRTKTFRDVLDRHFSDENLKALLSIPLLGVGGLPSSTMSAFIGAKLYSEFLLDGGYYPRGGMQAIPDALADRFLDLGGELRLSCPAERIMIRGNRAEEVVFGDGTSRSTRYVISCCDATQTFLKLIGEDIIGESFKRVLTGMKPSLSNFILYIGLRKGGESLFPAGANLWYFTHLDVEKSYRAARNGDMNAFGGFLLRAFPERSSAMAIMAAPFHTKEYWDEHKDGSTGMFTTIIDRVTGQPLSDYIDFCDAATPHTLFRYTRNREGSSFGWEGTPAQLAVPGFRKPPFAENLYLCGHWTTHGLGISGVVYVGYDTARTVLRKERIFNRISL